MAAPFDEILLLNCPHFSAACSVVPQAALKGRGFSRAASPSPKNKGLRLLKIEQVAFLEFFRSSHAHTEDETKPYLKART